LQPHRPHVRPLRLRRCHVPPPRPRALLPRQVRRLVPLPSVLAPLCHHRRPHPLHRRSRSLATLSLFLSTSMKAVATKNTHPSPGSCTLKIFIAFIPPKHCFLFYF